MDISNNNKYVKKNVNKNNNITNKNISNNANKEEKEIGYKNVFKTNQNFIELKIYRNNKDIKLN